jgi:hypothetical protein
MIPLTRIDQTSNGKRPGCVTEPSNRAKVTCYILEINNNSPEMKPLSAPETSQGVCLEFEQIIRSGKIKIE